MPTDISRPNACRANILHTIVPPTPALIIDARWSGSISCYSPCSRHQILPLLSVSLTKSRFIRTGDFISNLTLYCYDDAVPIIASEFCSWLTGAEPVVVFCCCSPSAIFSSPCLPVSSNHHSSNSSLTSLINKVFDLWNCQLI